MPDFDAADEALLRLIAEHRTDWLTEFCRALMWAGTSRWALGAGLLIALAAVVLTSAYRTALATALAVALAWFSGGALKVVFDRPRPGPELSLVRLSESAMPSTHAAATAAAVTAILAMTTFATPSARRWVTVALVWTLVVIGAAMIYLGGHWASDVAVGWALGAGVGIAAARVCRGRVPSPSPST